MNRIVFILMALCASVSAFGQSSRPTFQGGDANSFKKWVDERLVYDPEAKDEGIQGRVTLQFTIETDGTLDKVKVLRGLDPRLDAEAVRVVSSSPKWGFPKDWSKPITYTFRVIFKSDIPNPYPFEEFRYGPGKWDIARIYCITHGSLVITAQSCCIYIDPVIQQGKDVRQYRWFRSCSTKTVLLTHEHHDHFNKDMVAYLSGTVKPGSFHAFGNRKCMEGLGEGSILENGDTASFKLYGKERVRISAVPAYNTTRDHRKFHPKGNGNGYLIGIGNLVIYVAGDTEPIPEMKRLGKVDVAFLPVNQPYTMTPGQCIKAAKAIRPGVLIPYHMGDTDMSPVLEAFKDSGTKVIFHEELR